MAHGTWPLAQLRELYDDIELAILFDWFSIPRPEALAGVDPDAAREKTGEPAAEGRIRLQGAYDGYDYGYRARLGNASQPTLREVKPATTRCVRGQLPRK